MSFFGIPELQFLDPNWRNDLASGFNGLSIVEAFVTELPSGLPESTPQGRAVCIGPGVGGVASLFLAYADPPVGAEFRRRCIGVTLSTSPEPGELLKVKYLGLAPHDYSESTGQTGATNPGGPGGSVPSLITFYGRVAYLADADANDEDTQGFLTEDSAESTGNVIVGTFMPNKSVLIRPQVPEDL